MSRGEQKKYPRLLAVQADPDRGASLLCAMYPLHIGATAQKTTDRPHHFVTWNLAQLRVGVTAGRPSKACWLMCAAGTKTLCTTMTSSTLVRQGGWITLGADVGMCVMMVPSCMTFSQ